MQPFEWSLPTRIVFGNGRLGFAHKYLRGFGKRALILTSRSFLSGGLRHPVLSTLLSQLEKIGVECQVFGEIEPNPRTTTIDRAGAVAREFRPRYVLGIGGGSVMDAAKCVAIVAAEGNQPGIYEYAHRGPGRKMVPYNSALPIVCIPTVAATGSEANSYAVVTNPETRRKVTVFGDAIRPALSIIDPELTHSVPAAQTVDGAFDMICHVLETYLSSKNPTPVQDRLSEAIVESVVRALDRVLEEPRDTEARAQLSWCSSLALSGVLEGRTGGWPLHALEHGLSAITDLAHGRGLALLLPRVMRWDAEACPEKLVELNRRVFGASSADPLAALEQGLVTAMKRVGAFTTLGEVCGGYDRDELARAVANHALEVSGVWKRGQEPYLDNIRPILREDAVRILMS